MTIGVRFKNGNNITQIDENYRNMEFYQKSSVSCSIPVFTNNFYGDFSFTAGSIPTIAIYSTVKCFWFRLSQSGNTQTIRIVCKDSAATVEVFVFCEPVNDPSGIGIRIKNPNTGQTVYNSLRKSMKVVGLLSGNGGVVSDPINTGISRTYPNKKIAIVQGCLAYLNVYIPFNPGNPSDIRHIVNYTTSYMWTSGVSTASLFYDATYQGEFNQAGAAAMSGGQELYSYIFLDVTGF